MGLPVVPPADLGKIRPISWPESLPWPRNLG
jgi:hypothetical protein